MAGITPAVTSPFGNSGQNIGSPATPPPIDPGAAADFGGVEGIVTGNGKPATPIVDPNAAPPPAEADPFAALGPDAFSALGEDVAPPNPDEMSNMPAPEGIASLKEQFGESIARLKNSFAVTGPESVSVLKNSGLFDDVRDQGGTIQVKRKGRGGWENFDRDKFELVGDVLDFARDGIEAIAEKGAQVAGAAAGVTIGAPSGPGAAATGYMSAAASGAAGAVAAKNAGDFIAQKILGIPQDPKRNKALENTIAAGFGAGFAMLGSAMARRAAAKAAARTEATKTIEYATEQVKHTMDDIAEVKNSGIILGENGNFRLDPQQSVGAGTIPELDVTAKELSTEQSFRNFRTQVGDSLKNAYNSVAETLGAQGGKGAKLADDFILTADDVVKAEGAAIGAHRDMAREIVGTKKLPAQKATELANGLLTKYGGSVESVVTPEGSRLKVALPKIQDILRENPSFTETQARAYRTEIAELARKLTSTNGKMRIDDAEVLYKNLTRRINSSMNSATGRAYGIALIDLKNAVREDWTNMIGTALPESAQAAYAASKSKYGTLIAASDQLGKMLETDNLTRNELVSKLFEGKGSYKFAQSAKTLIQETNPKLWDSLAGEYFNKLKNDATDSLGKNVNWEQMGRKWRDLDPRLKQDLLNTTGIKPEGMDALLRLGARVKDTTFEAMPREAQTGFIKRQMKNLINTMYAGTAAKSSAMTNMISGMGKDQAMAKWLKNGGMEELLKEMPGLKPSKAAELRSWIGSWTPAPVRTGAAALNTAIKQTGKAAARNQTVEATVPEGEVAE